MAGKISGRWMVDGSRRRRGGQTGLAALTTTQLCALWRKSRSGLHAAAGPAERLLVVTARAAILDELERREPQALADWIAHAAADPDGPPSYLYAASAGDR